MQNTHHKIKIIDSHTGGEPTRLVLEGLPDLGGGSVAEQLQFMKKHHDAWRQSILLEPRGHDVLVGAVLCAPSHPEADLGMFFFNNTGYLGMCGHGTLGVLASLEYLGEITPGKYAIETPVGLIHSELLGNGRARIENVPSYRFQKNVSVQVPNLTKYRALMKNSGNENSENGLIVTGDIAWGGNWFFLVNSPQFVLHYKHAAQLEEICVHIKNALRQAGITGETQEQLSHDPEIDHIELFSKHTQADSQNFVLCPGNVYDRSPCGTGTSAKLACLAADGTLEEGETWRQASLIESEFIGRYRWLDKNSGLIAPTIEGQAFMSAEATLLFHPEDPFKSGIC